MAINVIGGASGVAADVAGTNYKALNVNIKPAEYGGGLGHYRTAVVLTMAISQAANSRLFELRNTHATNLIIPTRIRVGIQPSGTVTTAYLAQISLFRLTGFSAVDTVNTVTPTTSVKRTSMAAYPGGAAVRHNTLAGAAAGMTGGTMTKDAQAIANLIGWAVTPTTVPMAVYQDFLDDLNGSPLILVQNEGFEIENVLAGSATANAVTVSIDVSWLEATAY